MPSGDGSSSTTRQHVLLQHIARQPGAAEGGEEDISYQAKVQSVVVIFWHGQVHSQGHTVGKDGEQDDCLEGSGIRVKERP